MLSQDDTISYCFNPQCPQSIVNVSHYSSLGVKLEIALANNFNCPVCGGELISALFNKLKSKIVTLIENEQSHVILLDDDLVFHYCVKKLFNDDLVKAEYYTDGYAVLNDLTRNIDEENTLPDIIFLDLNMPIMDGRDFLKLFDVMTKNLTKKIEVYIISNSIDIGNKIDLSIYPFVKCFVSKASTLQFFKMLNSDLANRKAKRPSIILQS